VLTLARKQHRVRSILPRGRDAGESTASSRRCLAPTQFEMFRILSTSRLPPLARASRDVLATGLNVTREALSNGTGTRFTPHVSPAAIALSSYKVL
jgi:hypothetical protein